MDPHDVLFEKVNFDVLVPALLPNSAAEPQRSLEDLLLAHELEYALFDETLVVYVLGRVRLETEQAAPADAAGEPPTTPHIVQELFDSLQLQLDVTVIEPVAPVSPVFPSEGRAHSPLPPALQPPPQGMSRSESVPGLQAPSPHTSRPSSPVPGSNAPPLAPAPGRARPIPRRSSSIRGLSLSPGLPARRNSEMRSMNEGWSGTAIYQEKYAPRPEQQSTVELVNENWSCAFRFEVPIACVKLGDRSRSLLLNATISKERSSGNTIMAESVVLSAEPVGTNELQQTASNQSTPSIVAPRPIDRTRVTLSGSASQGSVGDNTPLGQTLDVTNGLPLSQPAPIPLSRAASFSTFVDSSVLKRQASKSMPVRAAANTVVKATWISLLENTLILAVELDNDTSAVHEVSINRLDMVAVSAVLLPCGQQLEDFSPVKLLPGDQFSQLYHLTMLDDDRKPPIQPPPPHTMMPSFARPGADGELPQLFTPAQPENKLRELRLSLKFTIHEPNRPQRHIASEWKFSVDASDAAKRRVHEQFRSGGARTVRIFPPADNMVLSAPPARNARGLTLSGGPVTSAPSTGPMVLGHPAARSASGASMLAPDPKSRGRRTFTLDRASEDATFGGAGLVISFSVHGPVVYEREFVVEAFLVNRSHRTKNFTVLIPSRQSIANSATVRYRRTADRPTAISEPRSTGLQVDTHMRSELILDKHRRNLQNYAALVCLDNHIRLSPLQPGACLSVHLHFIPFREHFSTIELVQLFDKDTGSMTSLRDVLDVYVQPAVV